MGPQPSVGLRQLAPAARIACPFSARTSRITRLLDEYNAHADISAHQDRPPVHDLQTFLADQTGILTRSRLHREEVTMRRFVEMRLSCGCGLALPLALSGLLGCAAVSNAGFEEGTVDDEDLLSPGSVVCLGGPDSESVICGNVGFWSCETSNGRRKCVKPGTRAPGSGTWACERLETRATCIGNGPPLDSEAAPDDDTWLCPGGTTCSSVDDHLLPPGGGSWSCETSGEFLVCTAASPGTDEASSGPESQPDDEVTDDDDPNPLAVASEQCFCATGASLKHGKWPDGKPVAVVITKPIEVAGVEAIRLRVTYDRGFVDNTYGDNVVGWRNHSFGALLASDKASLVLYDCDGNLRFDMALDYLARDETSASGYRALGVSGAGHPAFDGGMRVGDKSAVAGARTSLDQNFNRYGYVLTEDSPQTDASYSPDPRYPEWDFSVWYEVDVLRSAFGATGICRAEAPKVHASPSKVGMMTIRTEACVCG